MNTNSSFSDKWSPAIAAKNFTQVPNLLIEHLADLDITPSEMVVITSLLYFKWTDRMPYPSAKTLSNMTGLSVHTIRTNLRRLQKKKLIVRHFREGITNEYDFKPLIKRLGTYAQPIQKRAPLHTKSNKPPYAKVNTNKDSVNRYSSIKRTRNCGKTSSVGQVIAQYHHHIANNQ